MRELGRSFPNAGEHVIRTADGAIAAPYNPSWPVCVMCGVRHDPRDPYLPVNSHAVVLEKNVIFRGHKEQCMDRVRHIGCGAVVMCWCRTE